MSSIEKQKKDEMLNPIRKIKELAYKNIIAKTKCAKSENETSKTSLFSLLNSQQFFPMFRRLERIRKLNTK